MVTQIYQSDTIAISIVDDKVAESSESFKVNINFSGEPVPFVKLDPATALVMIIDNDEGIVMIDTM